MSRGRREKVSSQRRRGTILLLTVLFVLLAVFTASGVQHYRQPLADRETAAFPVRNQLELRDYPTSSLSMMIVGHVVRVLSADTLIVAYNGQEEIIRLYQVDRESFSSTAYEAAEFIREQVHNRQVRVEIMMSGKRDSLGRRSARILIEGKDLRNLLEEQHFITGTE